MRVISRTGKALLAFDLARLLIKVRDLPHELFK